jgi:hypothetical protein
VAEAMPFLHRENQITVVVVITYEHPAKRRSSWVPMPSITSSITGSTPYFIASRAGLVTLQPD